MAKMTTCPCGWVLISPNGDDDVIKHVSIHLADHHPGTTLTKDEMRKKIINL